MAERRTRVGLLRRLAVALAVLGVVLGAVGAAGTASAGGGGRSATADEAADLARQAGRDDAALARLRSLQRVGGQPVDLVAATAGVDAAPDRVARLDALATALEGLGVPGGAAAADVARRQARDVLEGGDYQYRPPPKPFRGALEWLGDRLQPVLEPLGRWLRPVGDLLAAIPYGTTVLALAVGIGLAVLVARSVERSSRSRATGRGRAALVDLEADPDELEAEADAAEQAGDLGLAVRRRYEAGILRLHRAGRVELDLDTTARNVAEQVEVDPIGTLTDAFEEIVYGGRPGRPADVVLAREGWAQLRPVRVRR